MGCKRQNRTTGPAQGGGGSKIEGFTLNPMPAALDPVRPVRLARLARAETAAVGHLRHDGFMDPGMLAQVPGRRIAGTAVTVAIPGPDSTLLRHVMAMVRPGDVLVIDRCGDRRHACFGGVLALACRLAGVAGAIIDGMVTDVAEIRERGVPVWARRPTQPSPGRFGPPPSSTR